LNKFKRRLSVLIPAVMLCASMPHADITGIACPGGALVSSADGLPAEILWNRVRSDEQANACLREVALRLAPEAMEAWLERAGFVGIFIAVEKGTPPLNPGETPYIGAGWPTNKKGLLYTTGVLADIVTYFLVYSQVFTIRYKTGSDVEVVQGKVIE
jgi:hypothetical protein